MLELSSPLIDTLIGLAFALTLVALIHSGVMEVIQQLFNTRGKGLRQALELLKTSEFSNINIFKNAKSDVEKVVDNNSTKIINLLIKSPIVKKLMIKNDILPSNISATTFSEVLISSLHDLSKNETVLLAGKKMEELTFEKIHNWLNKADTPENAETEGISLILKDLLLQSDSLEDFKKNISTWYDTYMVSIGHRYKNQFHIVSFIIAMLVVSLLNVNVLTMSKRLWNDQLLREKITTAAVTFANSEAPMYREAPRVATRDTASHADTTHAKAVVPADSLIDADTTAIYSMQDINENYKDLQNSGIPLGWGTDTPRKPMDWLLIIFGLPLTALLVTFGSNRWFAILKGLIGLKEMVKSGAK